MRVRELGANGNARRFVWIFLREDNDQMKQGTCVWRVNQRSQIHMPFEHIRFQRARGDIGQRRALQLLEILHEDFEGDGRTGG